MKRAGRWLFNFAAAASLVLCVATVIAWWSSYRPSFSRSATADIEAGAPLVPGLTNWGSMSGRFALSRVTFYPYDVAHEPDKTWAWNHMGFAYESVPHPSKHAHVSRQFPRIRTMQVSYAWPASLFALATFAGFWQRVRRVYQPGICAACGYDLRATPDRCPECGAIPEGAKGPAT